MWFPERRRSILLSAAVSAVVLLGAMLSACNMAGDPGSGETYMDVRLDESWLTYDSIWVLLEDPASTSPSDTLFHGKVSGVGDLAKLPAKNYRGQKVKVVIIGFRNDKPDREVTRDYDGSVQQTVKRDSVEHLPKPGLKLDLQPDRIIVYQGGAAVPLIVNPVEAWMGKAITWKSADPAKARVDGNGLVKGMGAGTTLVHAIFDDSLRDSTLVKVVQDIPILDVGQDTAMLINTTVIFRVKATQAYGTFEAFAWDLDGDGKYEDSSFSFPKEQNVFSASPKQFKSLGPTTVKFYLRDGEGNVAEAERKVTVATQVPVIDSLIESVTIIVGDSASFAAKVSMQGGGSVKSYAWDYEGDGVFEETVLVPAGSASVAGGHVYRRSGTFKAILKVSDNLGTEVSRAAEVVVKPDPTDAHLSSLTLSTGPINPGFRPETSEYTSFVSSGQRNTTLFAPSTSDQASVSVNGAEPVKAGTSVNLALQVGTNFIQVKVIAEDGKATRIYTIAITVPPNAEEGL
jgi:hypothetical protein